MAKLSLPLKVGSFYLWQGQFREDLVLDPKIISIGIAFNINQKNAMVKQFNQWYEIHRISKGLEKDSPVEYNYYCSLLEHNKIIMPSYYGSLGKYIIKGCKKGRTNNQVHGLFYALGTDGYLKKEWLPHLKEIMKNHNIGVQSV